MKENASPHQDSPRRNVFRRGQKLKLLVSFGKNFLKIETRLVRLNLLLVTTICFQSKFGSQFNLTSRVSILRKNFTILKTNFITQFT